MIDLKSNLQVVCMIFDTFEKMPVYVSARIGSILSHKLASCILGSRAVIPAVAQLYLAIFYVFKCNSSQPKGNKGPSHKA